jgi:hypothetical protein
MWVMITSTVYTGFLGPGEAGKLIHLLDDHLLPLLLAIDVPEFVDQQRDPFGI